MPVAAPNTNTQLSHALVIRANGFTVGTINEWSPSMSRAFAEL